MAFLDGELNTAVLQFEFTECNHRMTTCHKLHDAEMVESVGTRGRIATPKRIVDRAFRLWEVRRQEALELGDWKYSF